jgi:hypothetical protein
VLARELERKSITRWNTFGTFQGKATPSKRQKSLFLERVQFERAWIKLFKVLTGLIGNCVLEIKKQIILAIRGQPETSRF